MSVIKKPDLKIFAQDAKTGEFETFPDILRGWGITLDRTAGKPPLEWFNAVGKRVDEWLMYLTQRGVAEWDTTLSYPKTAIVQFNSVVYVSIKETKGEQPDKSQASWSTLGVFLGLGDAAKRSVGIGTNQIPDMSSFTALLSEDGWQKLPSGLIIQWGSYTTTANGVKQINFPTVFPLACVGLLITRHQLGSSGAINGSPVSKSAFAVQDYANGNEVFSMMAIGY